MRLREIGNVENGFEFGKFESHRHRWLICFHGSLRAYVPASLRPCFAASLNSCIYCLILCVWPCSLMLCPLTVLSLWTDPHCFFVESSLCFVSCFFIFVSVLLLFCGFFVAFSSFLSIPIYTPLEKAIWFTGARRLYFHYNEQNRNCHMFLFFFPNNKNKTIN